MTTAIVTQQTDPSQRQAPICIPAPQPRHNQRARRELSRTGYATVVGIVIVGVIAAAVFAFLGPLANSCGTTGTVQECTAGPSAPPRTNTADDWAHLSTGVSPATAVASSASAPVVTAARAATASSTVTSATAPAVRHAAPVTKPAPPRPAVKRIVRPAPSSADDTTEETTEETTDETTDEE